MASRAYIGKKPKILKHTLRVFLSYLGRHKKMLAVVAVLVTISAGANLFGTYMIRPVVNGLADGDVHTLLRGVLITALIFGCGALAAYGYTQTMVKAAQQVVFDIRRDLFEHVQTLPLQFFDSRRHGDIMSLFTNDIESTINNLLRNALLAVEHDDVNKLGDFHAAELRIRENLTLGYFATTEHIFPLSLPSVFTAGETVVSCVSRGFLQNAAHTEGLRLTRSFIKRGPSVYG